MINLLWCVICSKSSIDKESNNLSLFNIIEEIGFNQEAPSVEEGQTITLPINFEIVSFWESNPYNSDDRLDLRIIVLMPGEREHPVDQTYSINFTSHPRLRVRILVNGFPYNGSGRYLIRLEKRHVLIDGDWELATELPIEIKTRS